MTRKDYVRLAIALQDAEPTVAESTTASVDGENTFTNHIDLNARHSQWLRDVRAIAEALQADNDRFDYDRFVTAAGVL